MNFISEIFEFGALQIQPAARGTEGASIGFGSHFQLLVAGERAQIYSGEIFSPHPPPLCMNLFQKRGNYPLFTLGPPGSFTQGW